MSITTTGPVAALDHNQAAALAYVHSQSRLQPTGDVMCYAIYADGSLDQICEDAMQAKREAKDLRAMGCTVRIREFENEQLAYDIEDKRRNRR